MEKLLCNILLISMVISIFSFAAKADFEPFEGDQINIVSIGGSITYGTGASAPGKEWVSLLKNWFVGKYPSKSVNMINAGIGGTGSNLGVFRFKDYVADYNPDLVIIEFAVNDISWGDTIPKVCMESMVRQAMELPKVPYIVFLYTTNSTATAAVEVHQAVADYYGIPSINLQDYIHNTVLKTTSYTIDQILGDGVHPTDLGHQLYANYIISKFRDEPAQYFMKPIYHEETLMQSQLNHPRAVPVNAAKLTGSWTKGDYAWAYDTPVYTSSTIGDTANFLFYGTTFGVIGYNGFSQGKALITIDKGKSTEYSYTSGQYNSTTYIYRCSSSVINSSNITKGWHTVEVKNIGGTVDGANSYSIAFFTIDSPSLTPSVKSVSADGAALTLPTAGSAHIPLNTKRIDVTFDGWFDENTMIQSNVSVTANGQSVPFAGQYFPDTSTYTITLDEPAQQLGKPYVITFNKSIACQGFPMDNDIVVRLLTKNTPNYLSTTYYAPINQCAVSGQLDSDKAGQTITMMLIKKDADPTNINPGDCGYINDFEIKSDGGYSIEFTFDGDIDDYKLLLNLAGENITKSVTRSIVNLKGTVDLSVDDVTELAKAVANVVNLNDYDTTYMIAVACYAQNGKLLGVKLSDKSLLNKESGVGELSIGIPANTNYVKAFLWSDTEKSIPLCFPAEQSVR